MRSLCYSIVVKCFTIGIKNDCKFIRREFSNHQSVFVIWLINEQEFFYRYYNTYV